MVKKTIYVLFFMLAACSGVKKTQEALNTGNYTRAMDKAIMNLSENKTKKGNQVYITLLEEGFAKFKDRELRHINFLRKEGNPANYEQIFEAYSTIKQYQERIRPLLPLYVNDENRAAKFNLKNYDNEMISAKNKLVEHLYQTSVSLVENARFKNEYRTAYEQLRYLQELSPGYKDVLNLQEEAYQKGLDYVRVNMSNNTDKIIPLRLEKELLNMNTYGLNDLWTEYHTNALDDVEYDYAMELSFENIDISPEQIREKQISKEKQIVDGYRYAEDGNGNVVRDSLGNKIKVDKFRTVRCDFYQFTQFKSAQVSGLVRFTDLRKQQQINQYPLSSVFVFEHQYANYEGDKRALDNDLVALLQLARVPFPSNEDMVYDAGEDLKNNLKGILSRQRFNQ